jgi:hypothetical protein
MELEVSEVDAFVERESVDVDVVVLNTITDFVLLVSFGFECG